MVIFLPLKSWAEGVHSLKLCLQRHVVMGGGGGGGHFVTFVMDAFGLPLKTQKHVIICFLHLFLIFEVLFSINLLYVF